MASSFWLTTGLAAESEAVRDGPSDWSFRGHTLRRVPSCPGAADPKSVGTITSWAFVAPPRTPALLRFALDVVCRTERGRFELPWPLRTNRFSRPAHSTTLSPLLCRLVSLSDVPWDVKKRCFREDSGGLGSPGVWGRRGSRGEKEAQCERCFLAAALQ